MSDICVHRETQLTAGSGSVNVTLHGSGNVTIYVFPNTFYRDKPVEFQMTREEIQGLIAIVQALYKEVNQPL